MKTADDHIKTLRIRLKLLENTLLPQARRDRHDCLQMWEDEREALIWILRQWDTARRMAANLPEKLDLAPEPRECHGDPYCEDDN